MEKKNIISALLKAQAAIKSPEKKGVNPMFKSKYAQLDDIYSSCQKALSENDLFLTHTVLIEEGKSVLQTVIYHVSGESLISEFPMILEKQTNQSMASARTYACRYGLCNLLAINFDKDDDGNKADIPTLNKEEVSHLQQILNDYPDLHKRIMDGYNRVNKSIKTLKDLPKTEFNIVKSRIEKQRASEGVA